MTQVKDFALTHAAITDGFWFGADNAGGFTGKAASEVIKAYMQDDIKPQNIISVATQGGDYSSVKSAVDFVATQTPASDNRFLVAVAPGVYTEDPFEIPTYTSLVGLGGNLTTRLEANDPTSDFITFAVGFQIVDGITVAGVTTAGKFAFLVANASDVSLNNVGIINNAGGAKLNNASGALVLIRPYFYQAVGTMATGISNTAGTLRIIGANFAGGTVTTLLSCDGATSTSTVWDISSLSASVTTGLFADNSAAIYIYSSLFSGMLDGIVCQGGVSVSATAVRIVDAQQDAVRINDSGTGSVVKACGTTIEGSTRYDMNLLSATCSVSGSGQASINKLNRVAGAEVTFSIIDMTEDNEGLYIVGTLYNGLPERGEHSAFGQGSSYTRGMVVYTYNPSGAVWANVSTAASSASGSTFTFPAVAQDNAIYVASSLSDGSDVLKHYGMEAYCTVAAVLGSGEIEVEIYNGATWEHLHNMSVLYGEPYTQYAEDVFGRAQTEQIRYNLDAIENTQSKSDPMSYGTDLYWVRFRIATAITTAPVFEQFKLKPSTTEVNSDGVTEFFGYAEVERELIVHQLLSAALSGFTPGNATISFASGIALVMTGNSFVDNKKDGFGGVLTLPQGIDTSHPIVVEVIWIPSDNTAGDVELEIDYAQIQVGDTLDGTIGVTNVSGVTTVAINSQDVSHRTVFELDISELVPGELLAYALFRDALVGNTDDDYGGDVEVAAIRAYGYFWRP